MKGSGRWARVVAACAAVGCHGGAAGDAPDDGGAGDDGEAETPVVVGDAGPSGTYQGQPPADASPPDAAPDAAACAAFDAAIAPYASRATATVVGPGVTAVVCTVADAYASEYIAPTNRLLLELDGPIAAAFSAPASATQGSLRAAISIGGASPAVYTSDEAQSCGFIAFTYDVPPAAAVTYEATATSNCVDPQIAAGSWTVALSSFTPYAGDAGPAAKYFVVHGTLSATLPAPGVDAGGDALTVSIAF